MKNQLLFFLLFTVIKTQAQFDYFGQTPPDDTAVVFAPGIVSTTGYNEHTLSVAPDGNEIYFTRDPLRRTFVVKRLNNQWGKPEEASFRGREAIFSPDGSKLFFNTGDIKYIEKKDTSWTQPTKLGTEINTIAHEYYASVSKNGILYFSRIDSIYAHIYESKLIDGRYTEAKKLSNSINANDCNNYHPFISKNGDYLIFNSNRPGGFGGVDIYICFKKTDGDWGNAINLGEKVNSVQSDLCPVLSPDEKYLFFTRYIEDKKEGDVYWVSTDDIHK